MKLSWRARRFHHRPLFVELENRCLLSTVGWFDAPWRGFDTGYYPNGFGPKSMAVGDLDADGDSDVVVGNSFFGGPGLSVLKNVGDGTYGSPQIIALPFNKSVGGVALSDVDFDGDLDCLATVPDANGQTSELRFFRNIGNGLLARRGTIFATGPGPKGLVVGDFTGDGYPDIVTANYGPISGNNATISLLKHNGLTGGGAGYLPAISYTAGNHPQQVAAADLNGDSWLDLVVGRSDITGQQFGTLSVMLNSGAGSFNAPVDYEAAPGSRLFSSAVALVDMDLDGDQDLLGGGFINVGGSTEYGVLSVRRNAGDGTFGPAELHFLDNYLYIERPQHITAGDVTGDGFPDVVACTPSAGGAADGWNLLRSNGAGGLLPNIHLEASQVVSAGALTDADGDGDKDVLLVNQYSAAVTVHRNPGTGVFPILTRYDVGVLSDGMDFGDIDRDGDRDIVTSDTQVQILKNVGDGTFAPVQTYFPPKNLQRVRLRDLNGDLFPDLLLAPDGNSPPYHFATALNNGDGTFAPGTIWIVNACGDGTIDAYDLDNDGDRDVVLTEEAGCAGGSEPRVFIYRNDGNGNFTKATTLFPPGFAFGINGGDLNHDGNMDLVTSLGAGIGVFLGNGDLTFQPAIASSTRPTRLTLADMNADGHLDVAMLVFPEGSFGTQKLGVALGNGDGTFKPATIYLGSSTLHAGSPITNDVDAADINQDGYPDLVFTNYASNDLSFFLNNGNGTLSKHERYGAGQGAALSAFADFTGDRVPDVATLIKLPPGGFSNSIVMIRGLRNPDGLPVPRDSESRPRPKMQHVLPLSMPASLPSTPTVTSEVAPIANGEAQTKETVAGDRIARVSATAFIGGRQLEQSCGFDCSWKEVELELDPTLILAGFDEGSPTV